MSYPHRFGHFEHDKILSNNEIYFNNTNLHNNHNNLNQPWANLRYSYGNNSSSFIAQNNSFKPLTSFTCTSAFRLTQNICDLCLQRRHEITTNNKFNKSATILGNIVRDATGYDATDGEASVTQTWMTENLSNNEPEEQRSVDYFAYIATHIQHQMRENTTWSYANQLCSAAIGVSKNISTRVSQLMNSRFLPLAQYLDHIFTSDC